MHRAAPKKAPTVWAKVYNGKWASGNFPSEHMTKETAGFM